MSRCQVALPRSVPQGQLPNQVLGGISSLGTKRSRIPQSCFSLDFQFSGDENDSLESVLVALGVKGSVGSDVGTLGVEWLTRSGRP